MRRAGLPLPFSAAIWNFRCRTSSCTSPPQTLPESQEPHCCKLLGRNAHAHPQRCQFQVSVFQLLPQPCHLTAGRGRRSICSGALAPFQALHVPSQVSFLTWILAGTGNSLSCQTLQDSFSSILAALRVVSILKP